jgi:hypothetical protein
MPVHKKIVKITEEKYKDYYIIGTVEDLRSVGVDPGVPFL